MNKLLKLFNIALCLSFAVAFANMQAHAQTGSAAATGTVNAEKTDEEKAKEAIEAKLPEGKTISTASDAELAAAVNAAVNDPANSELKETIKTIVAEAPANTPLARPAVKKAATQTPTEFAETQERPTPIPAVIIIPTDPTDSNPSPADEE